MLKSFAYILMLFVLSLVVWQYPFLFELWLLGAFGGAYWLFFRKSDADH